MRGGEAARLRELSAEQLELQNELEAVHTEHAQRLGEVRQEQRQLEHRLEQLRQQSCACQPKEQEAQYNAQVNAWIAARGKGLSERARMTLWCNDVNYSCAQCNMLHVSAQLICVWE